MCKLQSYERSPKRCCDSQTHLWITIPTLLPLSCARTERCSQSAAWMSQAASRMCCSRRSCCGPQPEGWYLAPTHCCSGAAFGQEEAAKRANIPVSVQSWAVNAHGKRRAGICASAKPCAHSSLIHRTLDLIFIIINSRYNRNQTHSSTPNSYTTVFQYISEVTRRLSPDFFVCLFVFTQGGDASLQEQAFFKTENLPMKLRLWSGISQKTLQIYFYVVIIMLGWGSPLKTRKCIFSFQA